MTKNANCPECGDRVYFYSNSFGSRVFFDSVGPPWPKHPCTDRAKTNSTFYSQLRLDAIQAKYQVKLKAKSSAERDGWKLFKVLSTKSFRHEIQHLKSGRKFETSLLKDTYPMIANAIWIRCADSLGISISYFDISQCSPVTLCIPALDARKFATMGDWLPYDVWFGSL